MVVGPGLYVMSTDGSVWLANADGTAPEQLVPAEHFGMRSNAYRIAFAPGNPAKLYWTRVSAPAVWVGTLAGTHIESMKPLAPAAGQINALAARDDEACWLETERLVCASDPTHVDVRSVEIENPRALVTVGDWLIWAEGPPSSSMRRANRNKYAVETLVAPVISPRSLAVDREQGLLYWTDSGIGHGDGRVQFFYLDNQAVGTIETSLEDVSLSIAADGGLAFFGEQWTLRRCRGFTCDDVSSSPLVTDCRAMAIERTSPESPSGQVLCATGQVGAGVISAIPYDATQ